MNKVSCKSLGLPRTSSDGAGLLLVMVDCIIEREDLTQNSTEKHVL